MHASMTGEGKEDRAVVEIGAHGEVPRPAQLG